MQQQDASGKAACPEGSDTAASRGKAMPGAGAEATKPKDKSAQRQEEVAQVVLDYCVCVRGILNDDQGGPLSPPGLRMTQALEEVRASLKRNVELNLPGPGHKQLARLAACIDRGVGLVKEEQEEIREQAKAVGEVEKTLDESTGTLAVRKARYKRLRKEYAKKEGEFYTGMAKTMESWEPGLFVAVKFKAGQKLPIDNLELERWFRQPKRHERRIHGRKHAGVRIVQEGATLLPTLNAHEAHPNPFTAEELLPYRDAPPRPPRPRPCCAARPCARLVPKKTPHPPRGVRNSLLWHCLANHRVVASFSSRARVGFLPSRWRPPICSLPKMDNSSQLKLSKTRAKLILSTTSASPTSIPTLWGAKSLAGASGRTTSPVQRTNSRTRLREFSRHKQSWASGPVCLKVSLKVRQNCPKRLLVKF